jgi:pimeloyl-ACP methyl ester carboxylesterase
MIWRTWSAGACVCMLAIVRLLADSPVTLPVPEGPLAIGRTRLVLTDKNRTDPFDRQPRRIEVVAWYPAAPDVRSAQPAEYFTNGLEEIRAFATLFGDRTSMDDLAAVRTHATIDPPPRTERRKFPLLLFSHGYTSVPASSTALLEDLASHGYVVLSIVHPYEATASAIGDGAVATMLDESGKFRQPIRAVFEEWENEDRVLTRVTSAADDAERLRLIRAYLDDLNRTTAALHRWVNDARAVVSQLSDLPRDSMLRRVIAASDAARFGVFGHSMGGVMAGEFCLTEPRCAAVLNLDGSPQYGSMIDRQLGRPLLMVYSARRGRAGASDVVYKRAALPYYRVDVADTLHLDFTDMVVWPALRAKNATGAIDGNRAIAITRAIVREFFDLQLRSRRSALLAGDRQLAGVEVKRP